MLKLDPKNHERITAFERKERVPNDYRTKDDKVNDYGPAMTKQEEEDYYDKLADIELDSLIF